MDDEAIAAYAVKKTIENVTPVVGAVIATAIMIEIIDHTDDIAEVAADIGEVILLAPLNLACRVLEGINSLLD